MLSTALRVFLTFALSLVFLITGSNKASADLHKPMHDFYLSIFPDTCGLSLIAPASLKIVLLSPSTLQCHPYSPCPCPCPCPCPLLDYHLMLPCLHQALACGSQ
jgi:hypothetical protein